MSAIYPIVSIFLTPLEYCLQKENTRTLADVADPPAPDGLKCTTPHRGHRGPTAATRTHRGHPTPRGEGEMIADKSDSR
jgi:hypothetical protein